MKKLLLGIVFFLLCTGAAVPIWDTPTVSIVWDNPPNNTNVTKLECVICAVEGDVDNPLATIEITDTAQLVSGQQGKVLIRTIVEPMAEGTYWVYARYWNVAEKKGAWSLGLAVIKAWTAPEPPTSGCAILR